MLIKRDMQPKMLCIPQRSPVPFPLAKRLPSLFLFRSPTPQGCLATAVRFQLRSPSHGAVLSLLPPPPQLLGLLCPPRPGCAAGPAPGNGDQVDAVGTQEYTKRG